MLRPERAAKLAGVLAQAGVSAYFASSPSTMAYLHGLHEHGGERFLALALSSTGQFRLICPALTANQASRAGIEDIRPWKDGEDPMVHVRRLSEDWGLASAVLAVDDDMPACSLLALIGALPGAKFVLGHPLRAQVMALKDQDEAAKLRAAGAIADAAWEEVKPQLKAGLAETEAAALLEQAMSRRGGKPLFSIVGAGAGGAEPHHASAPAPLKQGDVVVLDFGCELDGYVSDITRTVSIGEPADPEADAVYDAVYRAHMAARAAIAPGVAFQDVDRAARGTLVEAGYAEFFTHRTGHGVGMNVHESPNVIEGETTPLAPGHCFSIEPGVYLAGRFGVRIENLIMAAPGGHVSFNAEPSPRLERVG